jgi:hypothetical protein
MIAKAAIRVKNGGITPIIQIANGSRGQIPLLPAW